MLTKSKLADSSRMFFVVGDTSVSSPPMTPASAIGPGGVGDDEVVRRQLALLTLSSVVSVSPALGGPDDDRRRLAAGPLHEHVVVEGVQRLAPFEHDVVRDVDDVVDRPHAGVDAAAAASSRAPGRS